MMSDFDSLMKVLDKVDKLSEAGLKVHEETNMFLREAFNLAPATIQDKIIQINSVTVQNQILAQIIGMNTLLLALIKSSLQKNG